MLIIIWQFFFPAKSFCSFLKGEESKADREAQRAQPTG